MKPKLRRLLIPFLAVLLVLQGCASYSRVRELKPHKALAGGETAAALQTAAGLKQMKREPLAAMGSFLSAADAAARELQRSPKSTVALQDYQDALTALFTVIRDAKVDAWSQPLKLPGPGGDYTLTAWLDPEHPERRPALYDYVPSATLDIGGSYLKERTVKAGLGAPLVAVRREPRPDARARFSLPRAYYGVTAVARFKGRRCEIKFEDPLGDEEVSMDGRRYPLAADHSAPLALMLTDGEPEKQEIRNLLRPGDRESARIVRTQPFDPNKTTVLVVHGLAASPATWVPMLNALRGDAEIRKHYQFWFFGYPSGYPYPYSAAILRQELDAILKIYPQRKPMILVGHSMGGLISRLMVTDSGDHVWGKMFTTAPEDTKVSAESLKILRESYIFRHRPEVGRVIFIASPHRGSRLASGFVLRLSTRLIRTPQSLLATSIEALDYIVSDAGERARARVPNSVDTLSPENPFVKAINEIPIVRGVPYHSIIGDRGKGDSPDSSDGVVPYWSSHLEGAVSEKIVPSHHSAHQNPEAITEVLRILKAARRR